MNVLDLFSGIGGFALGLESVGMRTVGFCEIEPFPRAVLEHHWPGVPIHDDVRTLSAESVPWLRAEAGRGIDLICGGFPCQDISVAGKGAGLDGARSGLWREYARLVAELRPRWVLAENVGALRTRGVDRVCADLEAEGYAVWPLLVGAWAVGAPHRRERVWIVARLADSDKGSGSRRNGREGFSLDRDMLPEAGRSEASDRLGSDCLAALRWPARPGEQQHEWEEPRLAQHRQHEPDRGASRIRRGGGGAQEADDPGSAQLPLGSAAHGLPERLARRANRESLKALGNSVVPQVVATIGRAILAAEGK